MTESELPALFIRLGITLSLAILLFGVYFFLAHRRARRVPISFFTVFIVTSLLYVLLALGESQVIPGIRLGERPYLLLKFVAYLGTAFFFLKAIDLLFLEDFLITKQGMYIPDLLRMLILLAGIAVAGLIFLRAIMGINVIALIAIPTALTAIVGFALQDTLKRFFAGLMLGKLMRTGDWVRVGGQEGRVANIDLSYVTIATGDDDLVMVPNNLVIQQEIINYNRPTSAHARKIEVDASYDDDPVQVQAVLGEVAKATPGVLPDPPPKVRLCAFKDCGIQYQVKFWVTNYSKGAEVEGQVMTYVWHAFAREGIEIPYPQYTINMKAAEPAEQRLKEEQERAIETLRAIDFLSVLSSEDLAAMAQEARRRVYLQGETVFRQGDAGSELFLILEGQADVVVGEGTKALTVATLGKGQFFGEMSLLTGEPRAATIVARSRLEVLVITKNALARPLKSNPQLAEHMGAVLVHRKTDTEAQVRDHTARLAQADRTEDRVKSMAERIRDFFGLAPA